MELSGFFKKMAVRIMEKLRTIVTVIVALAVIGMAAFLVMMLVWLCRNHGETDIAEVIGVLLPLIGMLTVASIILYVIIYYWYGRDHRCPTCHKPFSLKKAGREVVNKKSVSVLIETKTKNRNGDVIGSQEQYVPGERVTYRMNYICKKCGHRCSSTYSKDVPSV